MSGRKRDEWTSNSCRATVDETASRRGRSMSDTDREADHFEDIEDGCGCAEVWEHLSAERERTSTDE